MKKILKYVCTVLAAALGTAPCVEAVRILEMNVSDPLVFTDTIDQGDISNMSVFIPAGKTWTVDNEGLRCTSDDTWLWSGLSADIDEQYTKNCIISADFSWKDRYDSSGIFFRAVNDTLLYNTQIMLDNNSPHLMLAKRYYSDQWRQKVIADVPVSAGVNGTTNLKVKMEGASIQIFVDDVKLIDWADDEDPILSGKIGVLHQYGVTAINNIKVETLADGEEEKEEEKSSQMTMFYTNDEIKTFSDAIYDYYGWNDFGGILTSNGTELIVKTDDLNEFYMNHTVGYEKKRFAEEPIIFRAKSPMENYFAVSFKNRVINRISCEENDGYIFKVGKDKLVMEKWLKGESTILAEAENTYVKPYEYSTYSITQNNTDDGLEISVSIDGEEILKGTDTGDVILGESYINIVSYEKEISIQADPAAEKSLKQILGTTVAFLNNSYKVYSGGSVGYINADDKNVSVYKRSGVIMLPLRAAASALGAVVSWDSKINQAIVKYDGNTFGINGGYADYFKNNERTALAAECENINGSIFVPAEFFIDNFPVEIETIRDELILISDNAENLENITQNQELINQIISVLKAD